MHTQKDEARDASGKWTSGDSSSHDTSGPWSHQNKHYAHVSTASGKVKETKTPDGKVKIQVGPHPDHATAVNALRAKFPAETKNSEITSGWGVGGPYNDMRWTKPGRTMKSESFDSLLVGMQKKG